MDMRFIPDPTTLWCSIAVALLPSFVPALARADLSEAELWAALRGGGHVVLMRHANAPGTGDPGNFQIDDCATQRNLDEEGRLQARATGAALRNNGVSRVAVRSSQWCRCLESARRMDLGPVMPDPMLNSFFSNRDRARPQTDALRAFVASVEPGSPTQILVTHQVNISGLTKVYPRSGELIIVAPNDDGGEVIGRLGPFQGGDGRGFRSLPGKRG